MCDELAIFSARNIGIAVHERESIKAQTRLFRAFLHGANLHFMIHLESAAFVFHINATTPDSSGHCEPRVLSPFNGFWLALQLTKTDAPDTRVSLTPLARSWRS